MATQYSKIKQGRLNLNTSEVFTAWLAGLIDGDGNFHIDKGNNRNPQIRIVLEERDKFVLEYIQKTIGGNLTFRAPCKGWKPNWKSQWQWAIYSKIDCKEFTEWITPYLILKKQTAKEFLERLS